MRRVATSITFVSFQLMYNCGAPRRSDSVTQLWGFLTEATKMRRLIAATFASVLVFGVASLHKVNSESQNQKYNILIPYHGVIVDQNLHVIQNRYPTDSRQRAASGLLTENTTKLTSYVDTCKANSVPVPPNWPNAAWIDRGEQKLLFASFANAVQTEVFTYEPADKTGLCYALPRKNATGGYEALGIICQSRDTGKACFWDNIDDASDKRITGNDISLDVSKLRNGFDLDENCTDCHRGTNVFLIHPDTALGAVSGRNAKVRYSPIGRPEFSNPPATEQNGDSVCSQCHEIAALDGPYCGFLAKAADLTMPPKPSSPAGWSNPSSDFKSEIDALKLACSKIQKATPPAQ